MENKRSKGTTLIGSINRTLCGYLGSIAWPVLFLLSFREFGRKLALKHSPSLTAFRFECIYSLVFAVVFIITGDGLLKLKEKSRVQTIYLTIFVMTIGLLKIFFSDFSLSYFIYPIILIVYLTRPKVKEQFKQL